MEHFRAWLLNRADELIARFAGNDPVKVQRTRYLGVLLMGFALGSLLMAAVDLPGVLFLLFLSAAAGYAVRSFISYRRRQAVRRSRME
jgi:hypothetical protein